jgi:hypothetical protein
MLLILLLMSLSGLLQTRSRKPFAALSGHGVGHGFGTLETLISAPSDFVPKPTFLRRSHPKLPQMMVKMFVH